MDLDSDTSVVRTQTITLAAAVVLALAAALGILAGPGFAPSGTSADRAAVSSKNTKWVIGGLFNRRY